MTTCPIDFELVEQRINRVSTQYRESPKLLHAMRTYLRQVEIVVQAICDLPSYFDINTAVGDQLTLLGKRMGFPRTHCVCSTQPVFGFECDNDGNPLQTSLGFCLEVTWQDCSPQGVAYITINDDELYRQFLKVRRYQITNQLTKPAIKSSIQTFFGMQATILYSGRGQIVIAPGRALTTAELSVVQLYPRVLPLPLGIRTRFHFGDLRVFGFGEGWGGFCDVSSGDGEALLTDTSTDILTDLDEQIFTDHPGVDSEWMCPVDVKPYDC